MKKSAFIITKPIQYVNATNIPDENSKECFLIDQFYNVEKFRGIIEEQTSYWQKVNIYKTTPDALKYIIRHKHEFDRLYIDSDFGIVLSLYLKKLAPIEVYTYEEGYASYSFIRKSNSLKERAKSWIAGLLQLKNWVGSHPATKGMYLYQPEKFQKNIGDFKPIYSFRQSFIEHISSLKEIQALFENIQGEVFTGKNVLLYLTGWKINPSVEKYLQDDDYDYRVIKPHPHIKENKDFSRFDLIIDNYIPAEVLIQSIIAHCQKLTVVHEGSFALEYFRPSEKLTLISIPKI